MKKINNISLGVNKILKALATELTVEVTKVVTEHLLILLQVGLQLKMQLINIS